MLTTILRPRLYPHRFLATDHIVSRLAEEGYVHSDFVKLTKELAEAMRNLDREFLTPWEAVHRYLQALTTVGLTDQQQLSFALRPGLAERWRDWELTEQRKAERRDRIAGLVSGILERIPDQDRALITVDSWWQMIDAESGRPATRSTKPALRSTTIWRSSSKSWTYEAAHRPATAARYRAHRAGCRRAFR